MSQLNMRGIVTRTLALPVVLLLVFAIALSAWIVYLIRSEQWVSHTYDVLSDINETQKLLIDQETGLRAYILTADPVFLTQYEGGSAQFAESVEALRKLTNDNPRQQKRVLALLEQYRLWRSHAEEEKAIVRAGASGVLRDPAQRNRLVIRKQRMDQMRLAFAQLHAEEDRLLSARQQRARRANLALFSLGTILALACAALLYFFLRRQLRIIDAIYQAKVEESNLARHAAEALAAEVQEQADAMEQALLAANRERDAAVQALRESGTR